MPAFVPPLTSPPRSPSLLLLSTSHAGGYKAGEEANREYFDSVEDTEAFVAANDRMMVVVFRGTMEMVDWATNLKITRRSCPSQWKLPGPGGNMHEVLQHLLAKKAGVQVRDMYA